MEKKEFIIGKKISNLRLFIVTVLALITAFIMGSFTASLMGGRERIYIIVFFVFLELIYLPIIASDINYWTIDKEYLSFYLIESYRDKLTCVYKSIIGKREDLSFKIKVKEMKKIKVEWKKTYGIWSYPIYLIYFNITLKDGSIVKFQPLKSVYNKELRDAMEFLKDQYDIEIDDKYQLLKILYNPKVNLADYISKIDKTVKGNR